MSRLLVSFCNCYPPGLALGLYDADTGSFRWVDFGARGDPIAGVTGVCVSKDRCWCVINSAGHPTRLAVLDSGFALERTYDLREVQDGHSIIEYENGFLINDTAKNRLVYLECRGNGLGEVPFWSLDSTRGDVYHVNSVACLNGDVFVSMFGEKPDTGWAAATAGKVVNVSKDEVICDGLSHPHSLTVIGGALYWLESRTGRIHRYDPERGCKVTSEITGYLRGLTADRENLYVGASARRRRSRSTGTMNAPVARSSPEAHSWVYQISRATYDVGRKNFTAYGSEIYDLVAIPETFLLQAEADDAIARRIWRFEDELSTLREHLEALIGQKDARIAELERIVESLTPRRGELSSQDKLFGQPPSEPLDDTTAETHQISSCSVRQTDSEQGVILPPEAPSSTATSDLSEPERVLTGILDNEGARVPDELLVARTATSATPKPGQVAPNSKSHVERALSFVARWRRGLKRGAPRKPAGGRGDGRIP